MSMLSRVAERLYWMSRYLTRTEDTARLCNAYSHLIMDIPKGAVLGWDTLIGIINGETAFGKRYKIANERNVLKFMIADKDNTGSINYSIKAARENVRTTRDVLPAEVWEMVNEFYLYVNENAEKSVVRRNRFTFLEEVVARNQQINGLIESAASRDQAYSFLKLGRLLERCDMSSRVVDVVTAAILKNQSSEVPDLTLLWASLLKSTYAHSAYRREYGPVIAANDVVNFLFKNESFPRSLLFCVSGMEDVLPQFKNHDAAGKPLAAIKKSLARFNAEKMTLDELHKFIDDLQEQLMQMHSAIAETWFLPVEL